MHKYVERIVNVGGDGNCGFQAISCLLGSREEYYNTVRDTLIIELTKHRDLYTRVFGSKERVKEIHHALVPVKVGCEPEDKWMWFPEMGHVIANAYDRVCINMTRYGFLETYFPQRTALTPNPSDRIICVG